MKKVLFAFCLLSTLVFSGCGFEIVDTGHRGVKTTFGKVVSESLPEGIYFYNPISSGIKEIDARVQTISREVQCYTKDIQQAKIQMVLMVFPQKDKIHLLFQNFGKDWEIRIVPQILEGTVKTVIGKWDAVDLIANREKARLEIEDQLKLGFADKYLEVSKVELTNIDYNDEFEKAVEKKVVATQAAIEAQNRTKQVQEEAKQRIISAEAEAQSMKIRSQALSQNQNLVQYEAVQKWNGALPYYMMGNTVPFVNVGK